MKKRYLSLILALTLCVGLVVPSFAVNDLATYDVSIDNLETLTENDGMDSESSESTNGPSTSETDEVTDAPLEDNTGESLPNEVQNPVEEEASEPIDGETVNAPTDYTPTESITESQMEDVYSFSEDKSSPPRVLLIQDTLPWQTNTNAEVLDGLGISYDIAKSSDFSSKVELEQYGVVIFANDQRFTSYENYEEFKGYLELFAEIGGVIVFGACDSGWANGSLLTDLPGGVEKGPIFYTRHNHVSDAAHPIVSGELSDHNAISDEDLVGSYCSHTYFIESSLPSNSRVILRDSTNNAPTLVEYPLKDGRIIASGLTWEYAYQRAGKAMLDGQGFWGYYAKKAMDDLFLYAIHISNIQVDELDRLVEYRLASNSHHIIVQTRDQRPIQGAAVTVDGIDYQTDETGSVTCNTYGYRTVTVSAPGYKTRQVTYNMQERTNRLFILEKEDVPKRPYIIGIQDAERRSSHSDYLSKKIHFNEGNNDSITIKISAEWYDKTPKEYTLFQKDSTGQVLAELSSSDGEFTLSPGIKFKPGFPIMAQLCSSDNTTSKEVQTGIVIQKNRAEGMLEKLKNMDWFYLVHSEEATLNDSEATKIFPPSWSVGVDGLPIELSISYDNDSNLYKIRGLIGFKAEWSKNHLGIGTSDSGNAGTHNIRADNSSDENNFNEKKWKELVNKLKNAASPEKVFDSLKEGLNAVKMAAQLEAEVKAGGYFELQVDPSGQIISQSGKLVNPLGQTVSQSGGLNVTGEGSCTLPYRNFIPPIYCDLILSAKFDFKTGIEITYGNGSQNWGSGYDKSNSTTIKITIPEIVLDAGAGFDNVMQVGGKGDAKLEMEITPNWTGIFSANASLKTKLLWIFEGEWQLGDGWKYQLWPCTEEDDSFDDAFHHALTDGDIIWSPVSTAYTAHTTPWDGTGKVLQNWILPDTMPELITVGNQMMALFQANVDGQVKLVYSLYDGNAWSVPQLVVDDDTYDVFFNSLEVNGDVYVVCQKICTSIGTDEDIDTVLANALANCEIYVTKWDARTNQFDEAVRFTSNDTLDMLPRIAYNGNTVVAAWVNDPTNSIFDSSTTSYIQYTTNSGSGWSQPETLASVQGPISDFAIGFTGGNITANYITNGTLYSTARVQPVTDEGSIANGIMYNDGAFYWCSNGMIHTYSGTEPTAITAENVPISGNYKMVNGNKKAILWAVNEAERTVVYAIINLGSHWSQPIEVFSSTEYSISYFDAQLGNDGTWYTMLDVISDTQNGEKTSLLFHKANSFNDVALNYAYVSETDRSGDDQPVYISVVNLGDTIVTALDVSITGGGISHSEILACNIEPGAKDIFTINLDTSSVTEETTLYVYVDAGNESDYTNNSDTITLGLVDAYIDLDYYFTEDTIIVAANISNNSNTPAHASLRIIEDNESGLVIDRKDLGTIAASEDVLYLYSFDANEINFKNQASKIYLFQIDTQEEDYNEINNSQIAVICNESYVPDDSEPTEFMIEFNSQGGSFVAPQMVTEGSIAVRPTNPTRAGYNFGGWYKEPTCENSWNFNLDTVTQNITLYAKWTKTETPPSVIPGGSDSSSSSDSDPTYRIDIPARIIGGTVKATPTSASKGQRITLTVKPSYGFELDNLAVTDNKGNKISLSDQGNGKYTFSMPESKVTVDVRFIASTSNTYPVQTIFTDVPSNTYYYDAVHWAVGKGITVGTASNMFSPDSTCTRAQTVTFLWRAAGSPIPKGTINPFSDIQQNDYYYNAVLWAIEQGITSGTSATTFSPNAIVTRGQAVAFLYRAANSPSINGNNPFNDVDSGDFYADAVQWAVNSGVTAGTSSTSFSPNSDCTRGQIVTFLYRAYR